jgi:nucleoside-diphosphate-sugar epimerase
MNILVTGGAGYMGSVVSNLLLQEGHEVRVLDALNFGGQALLGAYPQSNFEFQKGDIRDAETIDRALEGRESVVHLAAIVGDPACAREPELAQETNFEATMQLFERSRRHGIHRFVTASTCSNYGRQQDPDKFVNEETELLPISLYAETKVAVERSLLDLSGNDHPNVTILRFATLFGLSPRMRFDLTVNEFTKDLFTKKSLAVYGEQHWRPYVHVADAARAIVQVLSLPKEKVSGRVYNVGDTSQNLQKGQLVDLIRDRLDMETTIEKVHKEEDPRDYRVSFDKIRDELDFKITRTVADGIEEIIEAISHGVFEDLDASKYRN